MNISQLYGVITVIIVVGIVLSVWYFHRVESAHAIRFEKRREGAFPSEPPSSLPLSNPMVTTRFPEGEHYGRVELTATQALVAMGTIPTHHPYWGLVAYEVQGGELQPVGDSVSSGRISALTMNHGVAAIVCGNPYVYRNLSRELTRQWQSRYPKKPLRVVPIYLSPREEPWRITLGITCVRRHLEDSLADFDWAHYQVHNVPGGLPGRVPDRIRNSAPREQDSVEESVWQHSTATALEKMNYVHLREIPVEMVEGDSLGNWDCTRLATAPIRLTPEESVVIVAVDHVTSRRATYSCLNVQNWVEGHPAFSTFYATYPTGDPQEKKRNANSSLRTRVILHNPDVEDASSYERRDPMLYSHGNTTIRLWEYIYAEPVHGTGPARESILPMRVFVVRKVIPPGN